MGRVVGVVRYSSSRSCAVAAPAVAVPHRAAGPRMSLSKRRSSAVGNKARLSASHSHQSAAVSSSSAALVRTLNVASVPQLADTVVLASDVCL